MSQTSSRGHGGERPGRGGEAAGGQRRVEGGRIDQAAVVQHHPGLPGEERGIGHQGYVLEAGRRVAGPSAGGRCRQPALRVAPVQEAVAQLALDEDQVEELLHVLGAEVAVGEAGADRPAAGRRRPRAGSSPRSRPRRWSPAGRARPGRPGSCSMMRRAPLARPQVPAPTKSTMPSPPRRTCVQPGGAQLAAGRRRHGRAGPSVMQAIRSGQGWPGECVHRAQQGCRGDWRSCRAHLARGGLGVARRGRRRASGRRAQSSSASSFSMVRWP